VQRIPAPGRIDAELVDGHGPDERVELRFLVDGVELAEDGGSFQRSVSRRTADAHEDVATRRLVGLEGERPLTEGDYRVLMADPLEDADLVVDLTSTDRDLIPTWTREPTGEVRSAAISRVQAEAFVELARARRPVRAERLHALIRGGIRQKVQCIERLRRTVDVKLGRRSWQFIRTFPGATPQAKAFALEPQREARVAALVRCDDRNAAPHCHR